jgi:hypothetical protein
LIGARAWNRATGGLLMLQRFIATETVMPMFLWMPIILLRAMSEVFDTETRRVLVALQPKASHQKK